MWCDGIANTSDRVNPKSLWPIFPVNYTGNRTAEDGQWKDLMCKALRSGSRDLHVYAVPRSDTSQNSVCRDGLIREYFSSLI